ncbi:MAG: serine/threonine-protein kinase [Myxococcota bacterium]
MDRLSPRDTNTTGLLATDASDGPRLIGRYQVRELLGEGSAGKVYACHDPLLDRGTALKILRPDLNPVLRAATLERFRVELKVFGRVSHPHVVAVYDANLDGEQPWLAMELCSGPTVADWLARNGPCSMGQAALLFHQVALALDHLHGLGIVHRDIKPANLLFHHQSLKLADFGVAQAAFLPQRDEERVVGTPGYMPLEQLRGESASPRSDLFLLAATLFELLTGQRPFVGDIHSVLYERVYDEVPEATAYAPELTPDFDDFFETALAREPADRFGSGAEMVAAFANLVPAEELEAFRGLTHARAVASPAPTHYGYGREARRAALYMPVQARREPPPARPPENRLRSGAVVAPWLKRASSDPDTSSAPEGFELLELTAPPSGEETLNALKNREPRHSLQPTELPFSGGSDVFEKRRVEAELEQANSTRPAQQAGQEVPSSSEVSRASERSGTAEASGDAGGSYAGVRTSGAHSEVFRPSPEEQAQLKAAFQASSVVSASASASASSVAVVVPVKSEISTSAVPASSGLPLTPTASSRTLQLLLLLGVALVAFVLGYWLGAQKVG